MSTKIRVTIKVAALVMLLVLGSENARADSFTDPFVGTAWNTARWNNTSDIAPYNNAYTTNNNVTFTTGNNYIFPGMGATVNVGNVTLQNSTTVTFTSTSNTYATGGTVRTINVGTGSLLDLSTQSVSTAGGTGFIKDGAGVFATAGNTYQGGFTLNSGTVVARGINAMGANVLTINGGTIAGSGTLNFSGKYGGGITVGGNFQLGELTANVAASSSGADLTFSDNMALGAATRQITIGANGQYNLGGVISGNSVGLTVVRASGTNGLGAVNLTNNANTYSGNTTISNGGRINLIPTGGTNSIANSPVISVASGAVFDVGSVAAGFALDTTTGQTLRGSGLVFGGVKVGTGTKIAVGPDATTVGTLNFATGTQTWSDGGTYAPKISSAGTNDQLVMSGLSLAGSTGGFTIQVNGITGATNYLNGQTWTIAKRTGALNAFDTSKFTITVNNTNGVQASSFALANINVGSDSTLVLTASAPEPTSFLLFGAVTPLLLGRRRRDRQDDRSETSLAL